MVLMMLPTWRKVRSGALADRSPYGGWIEPSGVSGISR